MGKRELLTVQFKTYGNGYSGAEEKWFRQSTSIVREYLSRADFTGNWLLTQRSQCTQKVPQKIKFISAGAHVIRVRIKPAGNDSVNEFDLTPPGNYDAETAFNILRNLVEREYVEKEHRIHDGSSRDWTKKPEPVVPEQPVAPPAKEQVVLKKGPDIRLTKVDGFAIAGEVVTNGVHPSQVPPQPLAAPAIDMLSAFKELMETAQRTE